ncbi:MAG: tetratricopeptide repeat protein [Armatimonadota bacterium]
MRRARVAIIGLMIALLAGCGNDEDSVARLRAEVRKNPESVDAHLKLGEAYMEDESYHDAFIQYSSALDLDASSFEATFGLARAHEALNNIDGASTRVEEALRLRPGDADALALHGKLLLRANQPEEAAEALVKAVEADPGNEEAHRYLPAAYLRSNQLARAEDAARAAVEALPDSVHAHMNLASALLARDRPDETERVLRDAIALDPSDPVPPLRLAELLVQQDRNLDEAVELSERSGELAPGEGDPEAVAALALRKQGRHEEALTRLHSAAIANPRNVRLWLMLASLHRELGNEEAAGQAASMAFRFAPRRRLRSTPGLADGAPPGMIDAPPQSAPAQSAPPEAGE